MLMEDNLGVYIEDTHIKMKQNLVKKLRCKKISQEVFFSIIVSISAASHKKRTIKALLEYYNTIPELKHFDPASVKNNLSNFNELEINALKTLSRALQSDYIPEKKEKAILSFIQSIVDYPNLEKKMKVVDGILLKLGEIRCGIEKVSSKTNRIVICFDEIP